MGSQKQMHRGVLENVEQLVLKCAQVFNIIDWVERENSSGHNTNQQSWWASGNTW